VTNDVVMARPLVVKRLVLLAAKVMGPGPLRLRVVKLAHELDMSTPVHGGVFPTNERL